MKTIAELNPHNYPTNPSIDKNLTILFERLLELQEAFGSDVEISSGLRSDIQQTALVASGWSTSLHSKHCAGAAADILDKDGALTKWWQENLEFMAKTGFWMEDPNSIAALAKVHNVDTWVHVQIMAPGSGKRVFIP